MKASAVKILSLPSGPLVAALGALALLAAPLAGCKKIEDPDASRAETARAYPPASRPVSELAGNQWSTETARDNRGEAEEIMTAAGLEQGMTVADIGAGEGYYTVRLAEKVGAAGRVLAQDIDEEAISRLGERVSRESLDNVSIKLGAPDDPRLPENSFDRIFLVHMYHEVREPYAFLSRLRPALLQKTKAHGAGEVIVVDVNRDFAQHGIPPKQLFCEFEAVGYELVGFMERPELGGYFARFRARGPAIEPDQIRPCPYQRDGGS
ncbi:class I SAM-dependent methyltransferase [uncultured Parasphingorhabdus sp.]|uniref:class I SAM-dependent methyltransferase n=1 Tax=uncultured Parasphingorhabdus sp. TaxID=2709694 RepID=UPI0030DBB5F1|tara:strand:- start:423 stop:1220 length:798 start_codon:yes stop_codon:yes gene_type:complete